MQRSLMPTGNQKTEEKAGVLATEKPVPSAPEKKTSQYVVTVDNTTGLPVKMEKLDEQTGNRTEFSNEEYGLLASYWGISMPSAKAGHSDLSGMDVTSTEAQTASIEAYYRLGEAYCRSVADYLKAITPQK